MEKQKPRKQVEALKQDIAELREKLGKKGTPRVCGTIKWLNVKNGHDF